MPPEMASFDRRGYEPCDRDVRTHLEKILRTGIDGFNLAVQRRDHEALVREIERRYDSHHVGFAFEGVGLYFALFDFLTFGKMNRLASFASGAGRKHDYLIAVGAGFAAAAFPWGVRTLNGYRRKLPPELAWCPADGLGFHHGIFRHQRFVEQCEGPPANLPSFEHPAFDSGVGRSLWWVKGASPPRIKAAIDRFGEARRAELWSGIGVACSYAGGVDEGALRELYELSGGYRVDFLSGVPFATRLRQKGENRSEWTERACRLLLQMSADDAADLIVALVGEGLADPAFTDDEKAENGYALLRERLTTRLRPLADRPAAAG